MAIFRKLHTSFWSDPYIQDLSKDEKLFYIYLMTNEKTTQLGVYEISLKQFSYDLGYSIDTVLIHLKKFQKDRKLMFSDSTNELALKNWNKYNFNSSKLVQVLVDKEKAKVKNKDLILYLYSIDTVSIPNQQEEEEQAIEEAKEKEEAKKKKKEGGVKKPPLPPNPVFVECKRFWLDEFKQGWTFSGAKGVALKSIITKIKTATKNAGNGVTDQLINDTFKTICLKLPPYYHNKDLEVIDQKFNEIINEIKQVQNGTITTKDSTGKPVSKYAPKFD